MKDKVRRRRKMSITKRKIFSEVYDEQGEVLALIDKPIRVKDLNIGFMGKLLQFDFRIVAKNEKGKSFKCICPICYDWVSLWNNWTAYKEDYETELFAKCGCGSIIPQGELICEEIK